MNHLVALISAIPVLYLLQRLFFARGRRPLPPGPPRLPIVGNLFDWPSNQAWKTFAKWAHLYGDIVYANVAGVDMILVNSVDVATEMLQGKSSIYSDRSPMHFLGTMVGWSASLVMQNDGPQLREQRRMFAPVMGTKAALERFVPINEVYARQFVRRILDNPTVDITRHVRRLTATSILDITYGYQAKERGDDDLIDLAERVMTDFQKGSAPGAYLVDSLPWLDRLPSWLPGTGFKQEALQMRGHWMDFVNRPFKFAKDQVAAGTARPSMIAAHIEEQNLTPSQEASLKWAASNMYGGGSDTVVSAICSFFLFMVRYPDVQAKAQAEIDSVVGTDRLPNASDQTRLPYVNALINEVYRYGLVAPQGVAHRLREDDIHRGYFIPKGALILPNSWYISRDPRNYKNPEVFDPMRFLGDTPELDPRAYFFGYGRRLCPGRLFAENNIFLAVANSLATLNISKALDENGKEITPNPEFHGSIVIHPDEYPYKIQPRSEHALSILRLSTDS